MAKLRDLAGEYRKAWIGFIWLGMGTNRELKNCYKFPDKLSNC
jgi:hypothetical protein